MNRIYGLDALRGIAALIVLFMHVFGFSGGHLAVDFFFMLSGYVMARSYEERLRGGQISGPTFLMIRYRRLWSTMAVGATMGFLIVLVAQGPSLELVIAYALALLLIPGGPYYPYVLNLPAWSIYYELCANAIHGAMLARWANRALGAALIFLTMALIYSFSYDGFPRIIWKTSPETQVLVIIRVLISYVIGIILYRIFRDKQPIKIPFFIGPLLLIIYISFVSVNRFTFWPLPFIYIISPVIILSGINKPVYPLDPR